MTSASSPVSRSGRASTTPTAHNASRLPRPSDAKAPTAARFASTSRRNPSRYTASRLSVYRSHSRAAARYLSQPKPHDPVG